jgi:tryptophan-rich sensory protein
MPSARYPALLGFLVITFAAAAIGSFSTFPNVRDWYPTLAKPAWTPPGWLFGPVWSALYTAMAIAGWRAWRACADRKAARGVLLLYAAQLVCNALWSVLFFGLRQPGLALVDIAALWLLLVGLQIRLWSVDRAAGLLWAPYVAWVSFASALNAAIWWMN